MSSENEARVNWYCVLTEDKKRILYARCFVYRHTPIGHRVIKKIDRMFPSKKLYRCLTQGREDQLGKVLKNVPAGRLLFGF